MNELIREFQTPNFTIRVEAQPEYDLDLSWDETGETRNMLERGEWIAFCAKASVIHHGAEIATDYLGECIYRNLEEFASGAYCRDMISIVCAEARAALLADRNIYLRTTA